MQAVSIPRVLLLLFMAAPDSVLVGPARELVFLSRVHACWLTYARTPRRGYRFRVDRACRWEIATYPGA